MYRPWSAPLLLLAVTALLGLTAVAAPPGGATGAPCALFVPRATAPGDVVEIDPATNAVTQHIGTGTTPLAAVATPTGSVYVTNSFGNTVSVIDASTHTWVMQIGVGSSPSGIAAFGNRVYVANNLASSVSVIDTTSNTVTTTIPVGNGPNGVAAAPWNRVYVTNEFDDTVSVIDVDASSATFDTVIASIPVGDGPSGLTVTPSGRVYVANRSDDTVSVIDRVTGTVTTTIAVGDAPEGLAWTTTGRSTGFVYVSESGADSVAVVDDSGSTPEVITTIAVGNGPTGLAASPSGLVYVANYEDDTVSVIEPSTNTVWMTIDVGPLPNAVAVSGCFPPGISAVVADDGRSIHLSGTGFPPSATVSVTLGSVTLGTATMRPDGSFDTTFVDIDCAASSGTLTVTTGRASASTDVALSPCPTPAFTG